MSRRLHSKLAVAVLMSGCLSLSCRSCGSAQDEPAETESSIGEASSAEDSTTQTTESSGKEDLTPPRKPVVLRRLNRAEYDATLRELLGEDLKLAQDFPGEDPSLGFDNIASALSLSPLQVELYERAAQEVVQRYVSPTPPQQLSLHWETDMMQASIGSACCEGYWNLYANGHLSQSVKIENPGTYSIKVRTYAQQMGNELAKMELSVDGNSVAHVEVSGQESAPQTLEFDVQLEAGDREIRLAFTNDAYDPDTKADRNLLIDWVRIDGPKDAEATANPKLAGLVNCSGAAQHSCYEAWIRDFGLRAWRRPLSEAERDAFARLYDAQGPADLVMSNAVGQALAAFLMSPNFLFRVEIDPEPDIPSSRALNDYELASRLSYFLWSSLPDKTLFDLASQGELGKDEVLAQQVDRMLDDPKAWALVHNFAGQWLSIRALDDVFKDVGTFPAFTPSLIASMKRERELFFWSFVEKDRSMRDLIDSDETFVNRELAQFYGLSTTGLDDDNFSQVSLKDTSRRGVLGQSGLMAVLGHPETTAPVLRGKWVLEHLLCIEPPPPPSDIDIPPIKPSDSQTMREQLAKHREDPTCASCHQLMDPIGLALENFDGIGKWRDQELGQAIDVSGGLPNGTKVNGAQELATAIATQDEFSVCVAKKALIYALGRDVGKEDHQELTKIVDASKAAGFSFRSLLREIVMSPLFRRRG